MRISKKNCSLSCIDRIRISEPGHPASQLGGGLKPGHPRHRHVEDREVEASLERALHGSRPSPTSATTSRSGSG